MYKVEVETRWLDDFEERPERFETFEKAEEFCGKLFDEGEEGDFVIRDVEYNRPLRIGGYKFLKLECPVCRSEVRSLNMMMTCDCNGIPFRKVCPKCYHWIMDTKGYDGERYSRLSEVLDEDYF